MRFPWKKSEVDDPTSHEGVTQLDISTTTTTSIEEASPGCCHYLLQSSVNVIHLLELLFGLVLFGYGILLALPHIRSDDDIDAASHHSATVIILLWSTLLIISSTAAVFFTDFSIIETYWIDIECLCGYIDCSMELCCSDGLIDWYTSFGRLPKGS